jgi:hypothetical protein
MTISNAGIILEHAEQYPVVPNSLEKKITCCTEIYIRQLAD